jgi:hypothetical protein
MRFDLCPPGAMLTHLLSLPCMHTEFSAAHGVLLTLPPFFLSLFMLTKARRCAGECRWSHSGTGTVGRQHEQARCTS